MNEMKQTDITCSCGGAIWIKDWEDNAGDKDFRFEAWCDKCDTCDPNGWPTYDACYSEAKRYFHAEGYEDGDEIQT